MKKKVGIILLVISVILIAVAFLFRTDLVNLLPENCQNVVKVKLGGSFVTGEDDIEIHKEVDNEEYEEKNISHDGKSIALEHAATGNFSRFRGGIIGVTETEIAFYNVKGEKKWAEPIQISMPVLRADGNFVLVFEKEGKRFSVYNGEKKLFSKTIDGVIKNGTISDNGDAVIVDVIHTENGVSFKGIEKIDCLRPVYIFSQTTKDPKEYVTICGKIRSNISQAHNCTLEEADRYIKIHNTICRQVAQRHENLVEFACKHSVIIFVSGKESSNGKVLYDLCKSVNKNSYHIQNTGQIELWWLKENDSVGICGATSTPKWQLENVAEYLKNL